VGFAHCLCCFNNNQNNFDGNGNLLHLDNIANLDWYYNNTLNKLTKADKPNTTQYYVYDYQGNRVHKHINSSPQLPLLNQNLSILLTKGLDT
jgi:hypothetical protein